MFPYAYGSKFFILIVALTAPTTSQSHDKNQVLWIEGYGTAEVRLGNNELAY